GGIGSRLKTPRATFRTKNVYNNLTAPRAMMEPEFAGTNPPLAMSITSNEYSPLIKTPAMKAMMKLLIAPAADTQKFATRLFRHLKGFTGVGLAQPISGAPVKNAMAGKS